MSTHPGMLIAWDAQGNVVASLDYLVRHDPATLELLGLVDFAAMEEQGIPFRGPGETPNVWDVPGAVASGAWPQYLGSEVRQYRVEADSGIRALVHRRGRRIERAEIEQAIRERVEAAVDRPADIGDLVGGPDRPLEVSPTGIVRWRKPVAAPETPIVGAALG